MLLIVAAALLATFVLIELRGSAPLMPFGIYRNRSLSGANVVGAHRLAERLGPDAVIVTLAVDTGFKYMSAPPYVDL